MPDIVEKVAQYMRDAGMPPPGSRVLVAVSGGGDSVALLRILLAMGYVPEVAHCNFGLRAAAHEDAAWVQQWSAALHVPCHTVAFTAADFERDPQGGVQAAARRLRYTFFEGLLAQLEIAHCATAHHADDQLETTVMSFFRGNGPRLLKQMPAMRGPYFRPLLGIKKAELVEWLDSIGQTWRHDASNDGDAYLRNRFRHHLLPALEQVVPSFEQRFTHQVRRYNAQQAWVDATFTQYLSLVVQPQSFGLQFDFQAATTLVGAAHIDVFLGWWLAAQGLSGTQIEAVLKLVPTMPGAIVDCGDHRITRNHAGLHLGPVAAAEVHMPLAVDLTHLPSEVQFGVWQVGFAVVDVPEQYEQVDGGQSHWLDLGRLQGPLQLRNWQKGDAMVPLGMRGAKLLSDVFIDQHRDPLQKSEALVVEDHHGIVLVSGYRIAAQVAISPKTLACLRIDLRRSM